MLINLDGNLCDGQDALAVYECSAMACYYLGETFDIHAGGIDLVFPITRMITQSCCTQDTDIMAKYLLYNGFVTKGDKKCQNHLAIL